MTSLDPNIFLKIHHQINTNKQKVIICEFSENAENCIFLGEFPYLFVIWIKMAIVHLSDHLLLGVVGEEGVPGRPAHRGGGVQSVRETMTLQWVEG